MPIALIIQLVLAFPGIADSVSKLLETMFGQNRNKSTQEETQALILAAADSHAKLAAYEATKAGA